MRAKDELKNYLFEIRSITYEDLEKSNPFVAIYLNDLIKIIKDNNKEFIEKACLWLKEQSCCGYIEDVDVNEFVEQFCKAMKGE